jgi:hypothetical protein
MSNKTFIKKKITLGSKRNISQKVQTANFNSTPTFKLVWPILFLWEAQFR